MIRYLQPWWLLGLLPVVALAVWYLWRRLRRTAYAVRFTNVELLRTIAPKGLGWRRHLPAAAILLCLAALVTGLARPAVDRQEPLERATVMLAVDVSLSMMATDVQPSRIQAAKDAAKLFVEQLPASFNIGLVSFAKAANVIVTPTKEHGTVLRAIDGLELAESTATGEAVFSSLAAIQTVPADGARGAPPARIVLLSDGYRTFGRTMEDAATAAASAHVPVSTIAFGTDGGTVEIDGDAVPVPVDRRALRRLAASTSGHYYEAYNANELRRVYEDMGSSLGYHIRPVEIGRWFFVAALLLGLLAAALSLLWTARLP